MPIGFYAISREDIKDYYQMKYYRTPDNPLLDYLCQQIPPKLDKVLGTFIETVWDKANHSGKFDTL